MLRAGLGALIAFSASTEGTTNLTGLASILATIIVGGAVGAASIVGLVNSQTGAPSESPASVETPVIDYGS